MNHPRRQRSEPRSLSAAVTPADNDQAGRSASSLQTDTSQTQEPNHPHRHAMISRLPDRLSGAQQMNQAVTARSGEVARNKAAAGGLALLFCVEGKAEGG